MLNIGPKVSGEVPEQSEKNLLEVGKWLKVNGDAIYNTRKWKVTDEGPTKINMSGTNSRAAEGFKAEFTPRTFGLHKQKKENRITLVLFPGNR